MSADPRRAEIDRRILEWMREPRWSYSEKRFEELALELFAFQFEHCEIYRRFCEARSQTPDDVKTWRQIPAVPTSAFKEIDLRCFPADETAHCFRTSGTSTDIRGTLYLDTLELYEASLLPTFRHFMYPEFLLPEDRAMIRVLAPSPIELPDSSLSHMFGVVVDALGEPNSDFDVENSELLFDRVLTLLVESAASEIPMTLCGTAFAFVHLIDHMAERGVLIGLPSASRIMETGGFKGRSREIPRVELYAELKRVLGISPERIINQYGMTELGSQFYDSVIRGPSEPRRKLGPPWARVVIVDPETGHEAATGQVGSIVVVDLANTGSVLSLQTGDLGRAILDGFEVIGREPGADARGCSIGADEILGMGSP
ncbi:MAG: long-chain fatty acid--CoA ligase [Deltaproteobacteria bacterium]|nr:long-chain fatty acid--CoA ligase [Deltaproteobacteria bacterium]